jgi:hypothetical protein
MPRLTKTAIDRFEALNGKAKLLWDDKILGFGVLGARGEDPVKT